MSNKVLCNENARIDRKIEKAASMQWLFIFLIAYNFAFGWPKPNGNVEPTKKVGPLAHKMNGKSIKLQPFQFYLTSKSDINENLLLAVKLSYVKFHWKSVTQPTERTEFQSFKYTWRENSWASMTRHRPPLQGGKKLESLSYHAKWIAPTDNRGSLARPIFSLLKKLLFPTAPSRSYFYSLERRRCHCNSSPSSSHYVLCLHNRFSNSHLIADT